MSGAALEDAVGEILFSARETVGVSRARCYAMDPSGSFRLAASYGFLARFDPEDVLEAGHPLIEWVQRHRRPAFVNSPRDAGVLGPLMERDHYAHSLTAPIYQGSRLVGILELQDKAGGRPFGGEDVQRIESLTSRIAAVLAQLDETAVTAPPPISEEDREALFLTPRATEFPTPPDLFSGVEASATEPLGASISSFGASSARESFRESLRELSRREVLIFHGFASALLLGPEVEAIVFSLWTRERGELYIGARRSFSLAGQESLIRSLEAALLSTAPGVPVPRERVFHTDFPLGRGAGEIREPGGIQTSVVFTGQSTLLLTLVFSRPPVLATEAALREVHRLVRAAVLQVRGSERYRTSYRSLIHFLLDADQRSFPQLKAHSLAVAALCRNFAAAMRLPAETVEQLTVAGLLHDIGLKDLDLPQERLLGRRPLDLQELGLVRQHAATGAALLARLEFPYPITPLVRHHHERFDGAGYPDRLAGDRIPLGARIIGIAEAFDAMVSAHSYRAPISREAALEVILLKGGTQFDPELARKFCDWMRQNSAQEDYPGSFRP